MICRYIREVACFTPVASSTIQSMVGWITGRRPEFVDPGIVAQEDGREGYMYFFQMNHRNYSSDKSEIARNLASQTECHDSRN